MMKKCIGQLPLCIVSYCLVALVRKHY